jgi:ABC-type amino acid transport substrate-binding protein
MISLGCIDAVMLDGSTAAQMRYQNANGTFGTVGGGRMNASTLLLTATWQ